MRGGYEMSVPGYIFIEAWLKGNFLIPLDDQIRSELLRTFSTHAHTGVMFRPGNEKFLKELQARIAALEAYEKIIGFRGGKSD